MSVLNQPGDEQVECPLCMEPLEVDDLSFFPCTCGYQICRFCWHRIRTDENGLCPACRKAYSENPADFIPLSQEQIAKLKAEKRQKDQQRKAKLSESRKHLASVRVVQRNLVFVVGLPMRLADPEVLKRHEYFGKFGKIHKVVINQSTSYAGSQGPSASAYVTYVKSDDALKAIQSVNNVTIDGRLIKSSLGTTKYCSHFMKNQPCPKPDCMYLHDFGDPEASFTKEQMHAGKHQEYEKKLHEALLQRTINQNNKANQNNNNNNNSSNSNNNNSNSSNGSNVTTSSTTTSTTIPSNEQQLQLQQKSGNGNHNKTNSSSSSISSSSTTSSSTTTTNKENWPQLNNKTSSSNGDSKDQNKKVNSKNIKTTTSNNNNNSKENSNNNKKDKKTESINQKKDEILEQQQNDIITTTTTSGSCSNNSSSTTGNKLSYLDDNSSFFSHNTFQKLSTTTTTSHDDDNNGSVLENNQHHHPQQHNSILTDTLPDINTTEDWAAAFGFAKRLPPPPPPQTQQQQHLLNPQQQTAPLIQQQIDQLSPLHNDVSKLIDVISTHKLLTKQQQQQQQEQNYFGKESGLDIHMSKFFMDFQRNGQKDYLINGLIGGLNNNSSGTTTTTNPTTNGYNSHLNNGYSMTNNDRLFILRQKELEKELMEMKLQQHQQQNSRQSLLQQHNGHYMNGDISNPQQPQQNGFGHFYGPLFQNQNLSTLQPETATTQQQSQIIGGNKNISSNNTTNGVIGNNSGGTHPEDELDFDPFQETQKALAELMANEQNHKTHSTVRSSGLTTNQINGMVHSQSGNSGHLPPPPPGFVQPTTTPHMNSFGSKILPYLNMSNSQPISPTTQNWPSYNAQALPHTKNLGGCNDWKDFDSAIVTTSRHYPLNIGMRDHFATLQQLSTQQQQQQQQQLTNGIGGGQLRSHDTYSSVSNMFSNFTQQLQQQQQQAVAANYLQQHQQQQQQNFSHLTSVNNTSTSGTVVGGTQQPHLSWFTTNELNTQISSPPGFRNTNQTSKQQEC